MANMPTRKLMLSYHQPISGIRYFLSSQVCIRKGSEELLRSATGCAMEFRG